MTSQTSRLAKSRVLHLSSVHHATDTRIREKECGSLVQAGFQVRLSAIGKSERGPDDVLVVGLQPRGRLARWAFGVPQVAWIAVTTPAEIYHLHDPELLPIGVILRVLGRMVIYDAHEDLPRQVLSKHWLPSVVRPLVSRLTQIVEWTLSRFMTGVVAATPTIAERFPAHKTALVRNFPRLDGLRDAVGTPYTARSPVALYLGTVSGTRGVLELIESTDAWGDAPAQARLVVAGPVHSAVLEREMMARSQGRPVTILPRRTRAEAYELLRNARVGVVTLHPTPSYVASYPVKLFEYMAAGLPVVASDFPVWREIVGPAQCGLLVDPLDPRAVGEAIGWLLRHPEEAEAMGRRGAAAAAQSYDWAHEADTLIAFYRRLLA